MDKRNLRRRPLRSAAASDSSDEGKDNKPFPRSKHSNKTPSPKKRGYKETRQSPAEKNSEDDLEIYETNSEEEDEVDSSNGDSSGSPSSHDSLHNTPEPSPEKFKSKYSIKQRNQEDNRQPSTDSQKSVSGSKYCIMVIVVVIVAVIWFTQYSSTGSQTFMQQKMDNISLFKTKVEEMKKIFPSQIDKFWKTILSSMKHILSQPDPTYPAIILLWVPKGFSVTASKFVNYLGESINSVYNIHSSNFVIDASDLDKSTPSREKLDLDKNLQKVLSQSRVVVVNHLEEISPKAVLLLHAYCDGDNAPYKNVSIVLVLHSSQVDEDLSSKEVDRQLQEIWSGEMDSDEIPALISRVANNVAIVKNEQHAN
ncbi:hypothetical protein CHS0354_016884 [Potamilus streckersoni]|uniref:Torsin-1A-interacting protein 1/2 AAA+ activator domain-containing protein n=1 Tax=Potamilus streckersoni TaxID=2493646 RepID=A0AAE0VQT7_9BIVA|nr:hypothetical protein CHS0354_016884 [Potamilus streckersoni]